MREITQGETKHSKCIEKGDVKQKNSRRRGFSGSFGDVRPAQVCAPAPERGFRVCGGWPGLPCARRCAIETLKIPRNAFRTPGSERRGNRGAPRHVGGAAAGCCRSGPKEAIEEKKWPPKRILSETHRHKQPCFDFFREKFQKGSRKVLLREQARRIFRYRLQG